MTDSEFERELREIKKDLEALTKKIDLVIDKPKKKDSNIHEVFKDTYQLFFASVMGAFSAVLIEAYIAKPTLWVAGLVLGSILGLSLLFSFIIRFTFYPAEWMKKKKKT